MLERCVEVVKRGKKAIYLAPSREVIADVREKIMELIGGLFYIDVITFDDLARNIAKDKLSSKELISTDASIVILEDILKNNSDIIQYYKKVQDKKGFVVSIYNTIRQIKKENLTPEEFIEKVNNIDDEIIKLKSKDVYEAYKLYDLTLKNLNLYDMDDVIKAAMDNISYSNYLRDVDVIFLDGYLDIFKNEEMLLKEIKNSFPSIKLYGKIPFKTNVIESFVENEILRVYKELGASVFYNDAENEFTKIAQSLFTFEKTNIQSNSLKLINAPCIEDEVRQVAKTIKDILLKEKVCLDKMALITNDIEDYENFILEVFNEYEIPVMLSHHEKLSNVPLIRNIINLLELKINFYDLNKLEDIILSPYIFNINDKQVLRQILREVFKGKNIEEYIDKLIKNDVDNKEKVIELKTLLDDIRKLINFKDEGYFNEFKTNVVDIIDKLQIKHGIINLYNSGIIDFDIMTRDLKALLGFLELLEELQNVYKFLQSKISIMDFIELLKENIINSTVTLKSKPSYGIKVLSPDLIRGTTYDYVFILGLNEGIFPKAFNPTGIFTSREKELLYEIGINLGTKSFEQEKEKIRFILSIASARKGLVLSYRTSKEDGSFTIKSQLLDEIIFGLDLNKQLNGTKPRCMRDRFKFKTIDIYTKKELINSYSMGLNSKEIEDALTELFDLQQIKAHVDKGKYIEKLRWVEKNFSNFDGLIGREKASIFNEEYPFNASKINYYSSCPFRFYIENLLQIDEEDEDDLFSSVSEGNIYHDVLKEYYKYFIDGDYDIEYDEYFIEDIVERLMNKRGFFEENILYKRKKQEILNVIKNFLKADIDFIKSANLRPILLEHSFVSEDIINGVKLKGRIDRIDMEVVNGEPTGYFVIYDYKAGDVSKKNLPGLLKGNDVQIPIYSYVVEKMLRKKGFDPKFIALLYYSISKTAKDGKARFSGIIIEETKKKIKVAASTATLIYENLDIVLEHIKKNFIEARIEKIRNGDFTLPLDCPNNREYSKFQCPFEGVCRFDFDRIAQKER
ncbi:MAG: PD-(D/E)XK nuclease family protein [Caloramator sp.]|nr:PD-(D/E)XK nuclease family protein [Caloramator sp.]